MSWTWTGYDYDAVHRFKDEAFFQTGRNCAEARFWKLKIHEEDRRGTKSSIAFEKNDETDKVPPEIKEIVAEDDKTEKVNANNSTYNDYKYSYTPQPSDTHTDYSKDYHYTYPNPRDRSMSIVSTISRGNQFTVNKDYQYSYPEEVEEEEEEKDKEKTLEVKEDKKDKLEEDDLTEKLSKESESTNKEFNNAKSFKSTQAVLMQHSTDHVSSRFY